jgi:hypothetical protein
MKVPSKRTLREVIQYLETQGLNLYGDNVHLESEIRLPNLRDYTAEEAIKLIELRKKYPEGIPFIETEDDSK